MSVLIPNASLGVRRRVEGGRDAHGSVMPTGWGVMIGPQPGYLSEQADATWVIGLDPALWPVRQGDLIISADNGGAWLITTADLLTHAIDDSINWVRCTANQRGNGGTEPGGAWFVNRYAPEVGPNPYRGEAGLFTGHGTPDTQDLSAAQSGDEYLDLDTGVVYRLGDG